MLWIRPLMPGLSEKLWLLLAALALVVGCKPKIGDDCKISTDCSAAGDRLCDITAPGGYCTVYNCEPTTCPVGESLCVEFGAQRSRSSACEDLQSPSPYGRAFCMAVCKDDSDCRSGYVCQDLSIKDNSWSALLIDTDRGDKACVVPITAAEVAPDHAGDVCRSELPPTAGTSAGGSSGTSAGGSSGTSAGGSSDTGGSAGAAGDGGAAGQGGAGG